MEQEGIEKAWVDGLKCNRGGNDGWKVFNIAQTAAFVAASMAPGQELDDCCTDESTER